MTSKRPATIADYIDAAPASGQSHLRRLYAILKDVAPAAEDDQVEHSLFRGASFPVQFLRAQGTLQLCTNRSGDGRILRGAEKSLDGEMPAVDSVQRIHA